MRRFLDLTTLSVTDSAESVTAFARRAEGVASVCVYPSFVETVGLANPDLRITAVVGGFPAAQTFLEVKVLETAMAIEHGADEVDAVMNVGKFLDAQYDEVAAELSVLRAETADVTLKVILETGVLTPEQIHRASMLAMETGADFIKTSTGKVPIGATAEAVSVMCHAIREFHTQTGRRVGIKVAGGVRTTEDAQRYIALVEEILGPEYLTPELFRIGSSTLF